MVTRKIPVAAVLGSMDEKIKAVVENHYSENPIESTLVEKLTSSFEETGQAVQCQPVEGYPLDVVTQIEPVQSGSGDPSPDNIRPIIGYATCKLHHSGKNLCNYRPSYQVPSNSVVVEQLKNGVIVQGSAGSTPGADYSSCGWFYPIGATDRGDNLLYLQAGQRICISAEYTILDEPYGAHNGAINITLRDPNGKIESVARRVYIAPEVGKKYKISTFANIKTTGYYCFFISLNSCKVKIENIQVEIGATATEYEPYQGNTFSLDLGQAVYGGSLDWKTGVLTITHELEVFDGNNKTLRYSILQKSDGTEAVCCMATTTAVTGRIFSYVCSHLRRDDASPKTYEYGTFYITGNRYFVAFIEEFADANELTAWLVEQYSNGTPFTIGYELATPITVQLTPTEILALSGANILTSDCGNTTVTGKVDPTAAVEKLTNAIIALGGTV